MQIASMRFHWVVPERATAVQYGSTVDFLAKHRGGYTRLDAAARACLLGITADYPGHEVFYIVAPDTMLDEPSSELAARYFPDLPIRGTLEGNQGFYDCSKAERILGWRHDAH
jgi:UDP-glucose 4-epimerase